MLGLVIVAEERAVDVLGGSGIELGDRILGGKASTRHLTHSLHLLLLIPRPAHTHRLQLCTSHTASTSSSSYPDLHTHTGFNSAPHTQPLPPPPHTQTCTHTRASACLEKVQQRAVRQVSWLTSTSYEDRLLELGLPSLEERRHRAGMCMVHKILQHKGGLNPETWFEMEGDSVW